MKKLILSLSAVLLLASPLTAQRLVEDNFNQLKVQYTTPKVDVKAADYLKLQIEGFALGGEVGAPALPMLNSMLTVPFCDEMTVVVENAIYDTVQLPAGIVMPLQPSQSKSDRNKPEFQLNEELYATDAFYGRPLASVEPVGVGRDRNYALLTFAPVSINPVSGKMVVCRSADITVRYVGADVERTMEVYDRYHTPAFSLGTTFNKLFSTPKAVRTEAPVRMVIVAGRSLQCHAIEEFANWKRTQGMMVDIIYTEAGASANSIAAQTKALYTDATEEAPAPTYLLLMGDVAQLKAHSSRLSSGGWYGPDNNHITDLYYVSWTDNDYVPDCYLGRFSATDTNTLRGIIDKTIYYERYDFANDDYLTSGILVAGVDRGESGDNAYNYGDPAMDYAAYFYVNDSNGFSDVRYYKNNISYAPDGVTVTGSSQASSTASILRARYNEGAGWINYTAHGDWNCWGDPEFTVNHANQMSNNDKPSFMLGNCCLTNKFEKTTCLGEALLRKGNRAGAIGYIGGTNSTYWTEDFYWSVGVRNNIYNTMAPQYNANNMGMYDRLFHTHNEPLSAQAVTASHMMMMGNMAVQGSTSSASMKQYYWEIYELMGDPSLMPWLGKAETMNVWASRVNAHEVMVYVVPGSYVALVSDNGDSLALQSAAFAGTDGVVRLAATANLNQCFISVTAQNYKPYKVQCSTLGLTDAEATEVSVRPNPASGRCEVVAEGLREVTVINLMGQTLGSQRAADDRCTLSLDGIQPGLYLLRLDTDNGSSVKKLVVK